ncbi:hypothetical protein FTO41_14975 [Klebsiella pneumoniae]|nr:hypothetical protein FTO41_14975 [Klebsiella pneumoniae]
MAGEFYFFADFALGSSHPVIFPLTGVRYESFKVPYLAADRCYYHPGVDHIMMPESAQFDSAED